jgi:hypothetical protein
MLKNLPQYLAYVRKAIINVTGLLGSLLALGLLPEPANRYAATAFAILTAITHYVVSNAPAPGSAPAVLDADPTEVDDPPVYDAWKPSATVTAGQAAQFPTVSNSDS